MSRAWVIDASVGFAWAHPDQATAETNQLLLDVATGTSLVVPSLWFLEIANGLLILQRRKKISAPERKIALASLLRLNPVVDEDSSKAAFHKTSELAERHGLTVYDGAYLELALRRKLPLATRDEALAAAAKKCDVKTL